MKTKALILTLIVTALTALSFPADWPGAWPKETLMGVEYLESAKGQFPACADVFSCYYKPEIGRVRVRLPFMVDFITGENEFASSKVSVLITIENAGAPADKDINIFVGPAGQTSVSTADGRALDVIDNLFLPEYGVIEAGVGPAREAAGLAAHPRVRVRTFIDGEPADEAYFDPTFDPTYTTNCAFMQHGNQSLSYTDVLRGRSGAEAASGFDEVLEVHQLYNIPGNFHMSGTIQTGAAWYDPDFNTWLANGVTAGWVEMNTSAYAQQIMPFVSDEMNNWSVATEGDMVLFRYGFTPRVAWVPERVFLDGPGGAYPNAGVSDYPVDDFVDNGVWAIILDDNVHLFGYDNHQIHYLSGSTLRLIPRDNDFTGKLHAGDATGALNNLVGMANDPSGPYRIAVYADDWEMAAEMGEWATTMPDALDAYESIIQNCSIESAWLSVWKLTDAVGSPDFNGVSVTPDYGTHFSIGGADGYGGADNAWYTHWAGYGSPSDQHATPWNFGYIWSDAKNNLMTCPDNNTAQAGWYVMMSMLYETGWHDGMGDPISGWEMRHSTHIKNANVYSEAARWTNGDIGTTPTATYADWDHDGDDELVIRNDRVCAVFEHIGGRAHWIFGRGGTSGWEGSIAGNCNAYWEGTEADYNDANHIAPLSDVGVGGSDYEHSLYASSIEFSGADSAVILLSNYYLQKRIKVVPGQPFLHVYYDTGPDLTYIKSGFTPDLVDVIWNAQVDRLWSAGSYAGYFNPNTNTSAAIIMGNGGASHSTDFSSTILKGDEIKGQGGFGFLLFAGELADIAGMTSATLNALAAGLADVYPPKAYYASYHPGTGVMELAFGDTVKYDAAVIANIGFDSDGDGTSDVTLDGTCAIINSAHAKTIRVQLSAAKMAAVDALVMTDPHLWLDAGAFVDLRDNPNETQTATVGDAVALNVLPNTSITIDGFIDTTEWVAATHVLADPHDDSEWSLLNELYDLYIFWDETYFYVGLHGVKESARSLYINSWLIYLDTDWGGPNGQADLTAIDAWDRNAEFSGGFLADIQYGSWGALDGDLWDIQSAIHAENITEGVIVSTDLTAERPGSEFAISWDAMFGLGAGFVPANADIAICASIAGSSDDDDLGGDCIPNQISAIFPTLDSFYVQAIDGNGDGLPDDFFDIIGVEDMIVEKPQSVGISAYPNPFNSAVRITVGAIHELPLQIEIFDVNGKRVQGFEGSRVQGGTPGADNRAPINEFVWTPDETVGSGIYLVRARFDRLSDQGDDSVTKRIVYLK